MLRSLATCLLLAASLTLFGQGADSVQSWTSSDGRIIQAKFLRMEADAVVVERDGKPITIPFAKLAPGSVELAKRLNDESAREAAALNGAAHGGNAVSIADKLNQIIIPKVDFKDASVREVIGFLHRSSVELDPLETDPERKGVKLEFCDSASPEKIDALRITGLRVNNVPLQTALRLVCAQAKLRHIVEVSQVTLIPQDAYESGLHVCRFAVPSDFQIRLAARAGDGSGKQSHMPVIRQLGTCGIAFGDGAGATLSGTILTVCNTGRELSRVQRIVNQLAMESRLSPAIRFRWLQTDPKTADAMVDIIKANDLSADALDAKIDPQVKSGQITEVAAFGRDIISGERFLLRPVNANLPLLMEAEAAVSDDGLLLDLRCVPEWTPTTALGTGLLWSNTALTLSCRHWSLFARWGDGKTDTLLLACGGSKPAKAAEPHAVRSIGATPVIVHLDAEWRETSASDLAKVAQAPVESRAKALAWLRGRSTLLASASGSCRSGQKSRHEHLWGGKSDAEQEEEMNKRANRDAKEPPPRPGVTFEWEPTIMASDMPTPSPTLPFEENLAKQNEYIRSQKLSLRFHASYMPPKSRSRSQAVKFEFHGRLQAGVPEFVTTGADPQQGEPLVALVLTPWYEIIR